VKAPPEPARRGPSFGSELRTGPRLDFANDRTLKLPDFLHDDGDFGRGTNSANLWIRRSRSDIGVRPAACTIIQERQRDLGRPGGRAPSG